METTSVPSLGARIRALVVIQIFFLLGLPVFGSIVTWLCYGSWAGGVQEMFSVVAMTAVVPILLFPVAFSILLLPAVIAGLSIGIRQAFFGRTPLKMGLALGVLNGLVGFWLARVVAQDGLLDVPRLFNETPSASILTISIVLGVVSATVVCWQLTKGRYFANQTHLGAGV